MIGLKRLWGFTHVCIGAAQQVVGKHLLVGCAVAVEMVDEYLLQAVTAEHGVGLVLRLQVVELLHP